MKTCRKGYTLIEVLVAVAVIGAIALVVSPNLINSLEVRSLENTVRDMMITMERAKFLAIKTKLNHRVLFDNSTGPWTMQIQQETATSVWDDVLGYVEKSIPAKLNLTLNLPSGDLSVVFTPTGIVSNYDKASHSVVLQSDRIKRYQLPDQRELIFYFGGSMRFVKSSS
jgi:prepilin-type N-terminal cleavage/methylation domain-containing protein